MTRQIELGLGDIRIECNDQHIYVIKTKAGTPGKILVGYELQDNGICKQNVMPAFYEEETEEPYTIVLTDEGGDDVTYTLDELLNIVSYSDLDAHLQRYLQALLIEDFKSLEEMTAVDEERVYYYNNEIAKTLDKYNKK